MGFQHLNLVCFIFFMADTICDQRRFLPSTVCTENISCIGKELEIKIISN